MVNNILHNDQFPFLLTVVVPVFNEGEVVRETNNRLTNLCASENWKFEIIYVNDGSTDNTAEIIDELRGLDENIKVIHFSRNFGHQIAVTAGLDHARGDAVIIIDADLQDPPEIIPELVSRWRQGYDVVYAQRLFREGETLFKRTTALLYYRLLEMLSEVRIPRDVGDFRLIDRKIVEILRRMPERDRFLRGMIAWLGYRQTAVPYVRNRRAAGNTKYTLPKMFSFGLSGIFSFSAKPIRIASLVGFFVSSISGLGVIYGLFERIFGSGWLPGWTLLFVSILFIGGVQLIVIGIIGEYVARIYNEVKRRPLYLTLDKADGLDNKKVYVSTASKTE